MHPFNSLFNFFSKSKTDTLILYVCVDNVTYKLKLKESICLCKINVQINLSHLVDQLVILVLKKDIEIQAALSKVSSWQGHDSCLILKGIEGVTTCGPR